MGPFLVALLTATTLSTQRADTFPTYADPATRRLVLRAIERHQRQNSLVEDYRARLRYRLSFALGRRRWGMLPTAAVEEQEGVVQWQRPNDLRVDIIGRRFRSRSDEWDFSSTFDRPWFVPRGLSDSVRLFGDEFPQRGALHPFAREGPAWYRYALTDSLTVFSPTRGMMRVVQVGVVPKRSGPALLAGTLLLDASNAEVVRFTFRYLGTSLWVAPEAETARDSAQARGANAIVNRILTVNAELEYGLQEGRYWMPYRQVLSGTLQAPLITDIVVPFQVITTFEDYEINTGRAIVFDVPLPDSTESLSVEERRARRDSLRAARRGGSERADSGSQDVAGRWAGGRYQVHTAPADSLRQYPWADSLEFNLSASDERRLRQLDADLSQMAEDLPDDFTGAESHGFANLADIVRYNRVQGLSLGLTYRLSVPGTQFTSIYTSARYGFSDGRILGQLTVVRDAPGGRWTLGGYRDIREVDPFGRGLSVGNSFNALFAAHDNSDYYLAHGGSLSFQKSLDVGLDLTAGARYEEALSVRRAAKSVVNDVLGGSGIFPANPPVREGWFTQVGARLDGLWGASRWSLGLDGLTGEGESTARLFGSWRQRIGGGKRGFVLTARAGTATVPTLPQAEFRLGGLSTVRGFDYGLRRGRAFWSAQADVPLTSKLLRPVLFIDAGNAAAPSKLFQGEPLVGAGVAVSILRGWIRLDFSHPITPDVGGLRFDLVFGGAR